MQHPARILLFATMLAISSAFTIIPDNISGTYGVVNSDPSQITLHLHADHTFSYRDHSNPRKQIDVQGTWELRKGFVVLGGYTSEYPFHNRWKIAESGTVAKSRKGLSFYTLMKK